MKIHEYLVRKFQLSDIPLTDFEHDVYYFLRSKFPKEHFDLVDSFIHKYSPEPHGHGI